MRALECGTCSVQAPYVVLPFRRFKFDTLLAPTLSWRLFFRFTQAKGTKTEAGVARRHTHRKPSELCCNGGMTRRISPTLSCLRISDRGILPPSFLTLCSCYRYLFLGPSPGTYTRRWLPFAHLISHPHIWYGTLQAQWIEESRALPFSFLFSLTLDSLPSPPITPTPRSPGRRVPTLIPHSLLLPHSTVVCESFQAPFHPLPSHPATL